ncbi:MAG: hypothetical protein LBC04_01025 [Holosporaceae bacterium]|nr:hypothetical protein [Holosporaceae bacterium]
MKIVKVVFPRFLGILMAVCFCPGVNCVGDVGNALKKLFSGKADPKNVHIQRSKSAPQLDRGRHTVPQELDLDDTDSGSYSEDESQSTEESGTGSRQSGRSNERSEAAHERNSDEHSSLTSEFRDEVDLIRKALLHPENKRKHAAAIRAVRELIILMCDNFEDSTDTRRK